MQWGKIYTTTADKGTTSFPRTFGTVYSVVTTMRADSSTIEATLTALVTSSNSSSFGWYKTYANRNLSGGASEPFDWIAVGSL